MKLFKRSRLLAAVLFLSVTLLNSCGDKGNGSNPTPPNPCASKTITVSAVVVNTTTGLSAGSITSTATGSTGFTYQLNNGNFQSSAVFNSLAAGTYTITAKDGDGCTGAATFTVTDPCAAKNIGVTATIVNTGTGLSNGSITATATNSTGFTYQLNNGAFQASGIFTALATGTYNITAKDADGCTKTVSFQVQDICAAKNITVTASVINAGPNAGASNGSITATAAGSIGFTYQLNSGIFQPTGNFTNLLAGNYTITAKDADGCIKSQTFTITNDPCAGKTLGISAATSATDKCIVPGNGTITITATGGTGFTYQLGSGAFQVSNVFSALALNTYGIAIKDADGCIKTGTAIIAAAPAGTNFSTVSNILQNNCALSGCHTGTSPAGGLNFTVDCTIVSSWDRIKARAVDGIPSFMPPTSPQLSAADKQKILDWIAAGHKFTD
ncbi:hypothetical protein [Ferruginibacter sp.]|nr:cytochrome c [Ferruginibacter sp.]